MQPLLMMGQVTGIALGLESARAASGWHNGRDDPSPPLPPPYRAPPEDGTASRCSAQAGREAARQHVPDSVHDTHRGSHRCSAAVQTEKARRATLTAFRQDAAQEAAALDEETPLDRRQLLLALRAWVRLHYAERPDRLRIVFDICGLPGAATALVFGKTETLAHWIDFTTETLPTVEWLQKPGAAGFQPDGTQRRRHVHRPRKST